MVSQAEGTIRGVAITLFGLAMTFICLLFDRIITLFLVNLPLPVSIFPNLGTLVFALHIIIYLVCIFVMLAGIAYIVYVNWYQQDVDWDGDAELTDYYDQ